MKQGLKKLPEDPLLGNLGESVPFEKPVERVFCYLGGLSPPQEPSTIGIGVRLCGMMEF